MQILPITACSRYHFEAVSHMFPDFLQLSTSSLLLHVVVASILVAVSNSFSFLLRLCLFVCRFVCLPFSWRAALWPHVRRWNIVTSWILQRQQLTPIWSSGHLVNWSSGQVSPPVPSPDLWSQGKSEPFALWLLTVGIRFWPCWVTTMSQLIVAADVCVITIWNQRQRMVEVFAAFWHLICQTWAMVVWRGKSMFELIDIDRTWSYQAIICR